MPPIENGVSTRPFSATTSPAAMISPAVRMCAPGFGAFSMRTSDGRSCGPAGTSVSSTGMMASAPSGTGAPVMMRATVRGARTTSGLPAGMSADTGIVPGTPCFSISARRHANPSIAEFVNAGVGVCA